MEDSNNVKIERGSTEASPSFYIKVTPDGPYLVYGAAPMDELIIMPDAEGKSWFYRKGAIEFDPKDGMALCRCGASKKKPFCDGSHKTATWDPKETAPFEDLLVTSEIYQGPEVFLSDNEKYCCCAQFCEAKGTIWTIVAKADSLEDIELAKHETSHCPSGRLLLWNNATKKPCEPELSPSLSLLQHPGLKVSGPIWVKGGIRIQSSNGKSYEIRNRVTLCRCGQSKNKPFCDASHVDCKFQDGLSQDPKIPHEDW